MFDAPLRLILAALAALVSTFSIAIVEPAKPSPVRAAEPVAIGTSRLGRPIVGWHRRAVGTPTRRVLVVGVIHGDEPAGRAVVDRLSNMELPDGVDLWAIPSVNPDGEAAKTRGNAHGVDLNRNFPAGWLAPGTDAFTSGGYDSGPTPASEPETMSTMAFLRQIRPDVTIWYHQPWDSVVCSEPAAAAVCNRYATSVGQDVIAAPRPGSVLQWQAAEGLGAALVVEFAEGEPSTAAIERHARAAVG